MSFLRIKSSTAAGWMAFTVCLVLTGCDLFSNPTPIDVAKPVALNPESDIFSANNLRVYSWTEGVTRGHKDSVLKTTLLQLSYQGDTSLSTGLAKKVTLAFGSDAPPIEAFTQLGLNPARLAFDTSVILDPGAGIRFPDTPRVGWRLDTTVGDLRRVRELTKVQILKVAGDYQQCWVFAESTYWGGAPVSTGTYWMGATGLVKHRREWKSWSPFGITGGTLWREVLAQ